MDTLPSSVHVLDCNNEKLYEGDSRHSAKEYGYRLLVLGTQDYLHVREIGVNGQQRFTLTREQAQRWYNRKYGGDVTAAHPTHCLPQQVATLSLGQKMRARRYANTASAAIFFGILVATAHAVQRIFLS